MDSLLAEGCAVNIFRFNCESVPSFSTHQDSDSNIRNSDTIVNPQVAVANPEIFADLPAPYSRATPDEEIDELPDFPDDCLKFISEILMEEDLDDQTTSFCDYSALQATEKSLYDALAEANPVSSDGNCHRNYRTNDYAAGEDLVSASLSVESDSLPGGSCNSLSEVVQGLAESPVSILLDSQLISDEVAEFDWFQDSFRGGCKCGNSERNSLMNQWTPGGHEKDSQHETLADTEKVGNGSRGRKSLTRNDIDYEEERKSKHLASYTEDYVDMAQYDDVLLSKETGDSNLRCDCRDGSSDDGEIGNPKGSKQKKMRGKKKGDKGEVMTLLTQCAQAVASFDLRNANELLNKVRLHSSQHGSSTQRVAHHLANALEARLAGSGWQKCRDFASRRVPFSKVLKAYREQVSAIPSRRASYFVANDAIVKLAEKATRIHIIDFGIFFGFQWPGLIQELSKRPVGPPMLRITGIDYPQTGFRPAQRVEETGQRLAGYCKRFNVPFRYQAIAKGWEGITPQELNIERDELMIVNCLYMARKLVDETVEENNPRDTFLRLIRKLNPDFFIHGIVNGTFSAPFFVTRFKEALFHYSSVFDMLEATLPQESEERLLVENHMYGRDALNVIACEGTERFERPETYRQWQVRIQRAGFMKLPLGYEAVKRVKDHVKQNHHKDFLIDEDGYWMFQGWKGRILYALSCWTPI